jgi:hypothetical protein
MHSVTRNVLLVAFGLIAATGVGLKLADEPQPISAQVSSPGTCGASCDTDTNCNDQSFCHFTINWESWQEQTSALNNVGTGPITGWNTHHKLNDDTIFHMTKGGKVYTKHLGDWDGGNDFSSCFGAAEGQCGTLTTSKGGFSNLPNPVVGYNTYILTENGTQVLTTHLVRYREIFYRKSNYVNGNAIEAWKKVTDLDNLLTTHGGNWNQWAYLSFDSSVAYEDGRQQQRLVIGRVDDKGTTTVNDDAIYETKMLVRMNVRNADGNFTWSSWQLAANTSNSVGSYNLGGSSAKGSLISYDSAYNPETLRYQDTIVRWYWNGSAHVPQVWQREALKRANTQKECRPLVYPQSCTMPDYVPAQPTSTPPPPNEVPAPQNLSAQIACTAGKSSFSWRLPENQSNFELGHTVFEYCLNTNSTTPCANPQRLELSHAGQPSQLSREVMLSQFNLSKGQTALVRLRLSPKTVLQGIYDGPASSYIEVKYTGPAGDFNNDCRVSISDYDDIKSQLLTPDEPDFNISSNAGLSLINKVVRNFGNYN